MNDPYAAYGLRRVINCAGPLTVLGAAQVDREVIAAAEAVLAGAVVMSELQAAASEAIATTLGAEAGCVTGCVAAGIAVAVAACMTGTDVAQIERIPDTSGMKNEVVLLKGHDCSFGASTSQMIRLAGARPVEVGTATYSAAYQLRAAITERTAAALYVVSHHTVPFGMLDLASFCAICRERGVPVIVDGAAQRNQADFLAAGADLTLVSAQKFLGGLTAGIIAGRADLVAACDLQRRGIGRPMKVGKEGIAGVIAALQRWRARDHDGIRRAEIGRLDAAAAMLSAVPGLSVQRRTDSLDPSVDRLVVRVQPDRAGLTAHTLAGELAQDDPAVYVRNFNVDEGYVELDASCVGDDEIRVACDRIAGLVNAARSGGVHPGRWMLYQDGSVGPAPARAAD